MTAKFPLYDYASSGRPSAPKTLRLRLRAASIHKALQDDDGGYLIDHFAVLRSRTARLIQKAVGLRGSQALIPQMYGKLRFFGEQSGECLRLLCLTALLSGEMKRVADDDFLTAVFAGKPRQRPQIFARLFAIQGQDRLRGQTETVGYRNADAAISNVKTHEARYCILLHKSILRGC